MLKTGLRVAENSVVNSMPLKDHLVSNQQGLRLGVARRIHFLAVLMAGQRRVRLINLQIHSFVCC